MSWLTVLAKAALIYTVIALAVRTLPLFDLLGLVVAVSFPYVVIPAAAALMVLLIGRRWLLTCAAALILILVIAAQAPWYYGRQQLPNEPHTSIRVLSSNLRLGQVSTDAFVDIATGSADVITVSELTAAAAERLQAGLADDFPYAALIPMPGAAGIGLWSRFPFESVHDSNHGNAHVAAQIRVPGVRHDPVVASVHLMSPIAAGGNTFDGWHDSVEATHQGLVDYTGLAGPGAVIVAGDFNSTVDMRQFRDLLDIGYQDAVEQTGAGFLPTYSPHRWIPPVLAIDHVLTRNARATAISTVRIPGTDHRALLATVAVPRDPPAR
ncbi:endonuclease/exonuclease/phosphatase family protein [Mycobacterium sp. C31M]